MKKVIAVLCIVLILSILLISCGGNNNNDTNTTNEGMITETGTDTNIVDRARSMIDGVESGIGNMMGQSR